MAKTGQGSRSVNKSIRMVETLSRSSDAIGVSSADVSDCGYEAKRKQNQRLGRLAIMHLSEKRVSALPGLIRFLRLEPHQRVLKQVNQALATPDPVIFVLASLGWIVKDLKCGPDRPTSGLSANWERDAHTGKGLQGAPNVGFISRAPRKGG
jgi:hypothetical protein